jgi:hypothetical protein
MSLPALVLTLGFAAPAPASVDLPGYRDAYQRTQRAGMTVLMGWAVGNLSTGIAGALTVSGDARYIHEMNAMWNAVNLGLGIAGLVGARKPPKADNAAAAQRVYRKVRTVFLVNNLLDVVYITGGIVTRELGRQHDVPRAEGWGRSIILQGAFLFAFDLGMLIAHERIATRAGVRLLPTAGRAQAGIAVTGRF